MQTKRTVRRQDQPESAAAQTGKDVNRDMEAATNEAGFRFSWEKSSGPERTD